MAVASTPGSGIVRIVTIALLSLPLAGCYGILVPKPLPGWVAVSSGEAAAPVRSTAVRDGERRGPDRGPPSHVTPSDTPRADLLPFTPEWQAREDAFDNRLRRTMNICRGC